MAGAEIAFPSTPRAQVFAWEPARSGAVAPLHRHAGEEWQFLRRGRLRLVVAGHPCDLRPGDLLRLEAGRDHAVLETSPDCRKWVLWTRTATADDDEEHPAVRHLPARDQADLDACCRLAERHRDLPGAGEALALAAIASAAAFHRRAAAGRPAEALHPAVLTACRLIAGRGGAVSLDLVAARSGLSRSRLGHLFTTETGVRLVDFRNRCRLEHFVGLRAERPTATLADLARACGFSSYMQFYRMHRRLLGCAPAAGR